ncbi:putative disease resistance RPP13-like protein 1 isoform X2 [Humulus lupulus]|nr:putative disease resistance RPP13-like protein 1 isoform X2 [Humulus lupulus]
MALELVGGALLSVALDKLFEKLTSPAFVNFISGKKTIDDDYLLKELKMKLRRARVLLNDAEERQLEEEAVREWLDELKDVIYKAQDLVDDIDHELLSMSLERDHKSKTKTNFRKNIKTKVFSSFSKLDKTTAVKGEITKILKDLTLLLENDVGRDLKVFEETSTSGASSRIRVTPWPEKNQVHGRDDDKDKIIELLLSNNIWGSKIGVLPIVGMGGLGKTTLAQLIYDDNRFEEQGFQYKAWVTVSTDFDAFRIMRIILQQINPSGRDDYFDEPTILQRSLNEALKGKKFLIVLDDVWDEDYNNWSVIWSTFGFGECSSRIIVTTRSKKVASNVKTMPIYELQLLEDEHCWKIFVEHAFGGDSNADQFLEEIGRKLVDKCGGIPLAITSLGGLLRSENDPKHWEGILNNHAWKTNKILPSLWLSYRYLPSPLKQCFTYCSVFPKDYEFEKKEMILLWMAEGYLQCDQKQKQMEEIGEEYFNNLISRSLFQRSRKPYGERFVVHDLVHDLAMFISREFCLALDDNNKSKLFSRKIHHLSFALVPDHYDHHESLKTCLCKAKNLRTFIGQGQGHLNFIPSYDGVVKELIATKSHLRVFCLCMSSLHNSIANDLKHVRYLNLSHSHIREIPCSLCTMYNLQTLLLSHCGNLNRLPKDMGRLVNLRHLETTGSGLVEMPPQMGNLKQLQTLTDFILSDTDHGSGIRELVELQHLGGHLCISGLQNVTDVDDIVRVNLRSRKKLSDLCFEWKCDTTCTRREQFGKVLEALEPHRNLEKLTIRYYPGSSFPRWVGDSQYSRIISVDLCGNKSCVFLPPLGQLPFLKALKLKGFDEVESMGAEVYYGNNSFGAIAPFQSLERLSIEKMAKLKKWLFVGDDEKEGGCFPRLKRLWLFHCPNTTDYLLPDGHEIESLQIEDSYKLMEYLPLNRYPRLEWLCLWDCDFVKSLPLQNFPSLKWLFLNECDHLESLIVPPKIEVLSEGGLVSKLELLKIDKCNKVLAQHAQWDLEGLKSLKSLVVKNCDVVLDSFPGGSLPFSLTSLELDSLSCLRSLNENTFQKLTCLESLTIRHCSELHNIPEQGLQCLSCLQSLVIRNCGVLERRYQRGKGEGWDKISHIPHISIYGMTIIS